MQHTPGPWDYEPYEDSPPESAIIGGVYQIAVVGYDDAEYSNARLIAAAPDLLAACEVAIAAYDQAKLEGKSRWLGTEVDAMREAIAKARGI